MKTEEQTVLGEGSSMVKDKKVKLEEDGDEFRRCCEDEDEIKEKEESTKEDLNDNFDSDFKNLDFYVEELAAATGITGPGMVEITTAPFIERIKLSHYFAFFHYALFVAEVKKKMS
ncbi:Hypothetical predicted protein [Olea europaea subsp. europaea]|uniref:Uncharacterized protein n=1 Tax=Olea europaea subsp. europaea TaxID=158383 RepID=A0A8S0PDH3_OLEEU|nr:Hypothetical predicted protein [Olea europaea subsp. europaea]